MPVSRIRPEVVLNARPDVATKVPLPSVNWIAPTVPVADVGVDVAHFVDVPVVVST